MKNSVNSWIKFKEKNNKAGENFWKDLEMDIGKIHKFMSNRLPYTSKNKNNVPNF